MTHVGDPEEAPDFWLWICPVPATVATWEMSQWAGHLILCLSLYKPYISNKQIHHS